MSGGLISGVVGGVAGALFKWLAGREAIRDAEKKGQVEQAAKDQAAVTQKVEEAHDVEARVDALSDADRQRLRDQWTDNAGSD